MPIEFRCSQCGKLLRTGDDTAGQQAQCPECGSLTQVPDVARTSEPPRPAAPLPAGNPFGPGGPEGSLPPQGYPGHFMPPVERVSAPATALIITGYLGVFFDVLYLLFCLAQIGIGVGMAHAEDKIPILIGSSVHLVFAVIGLGVSILVIVGATRMKNLEHYAFAMAAAILAVIPCMSPCCLLGIPFGIWAIMVLNDSSVKAAFRS